MKWWRATGGSGPPGPVAGLASTADPLEPVYLPTLRVLSWLPPITANHVSHIQRPEMWNCRQATNAEQRLRPTFFSRSLVVQVEIDDTSAMVYFQGAGIERAG